MQNKLIRAIGLATIFATSIAATAPALAAKRGSACTSVSSQMSNIYEVKFLCPEISRDQRLTISEIYNKGYRVASLAFQGNIAALIVESQ